QSVTPIAVAQGERTIQWGTGTLLRVADESFLVTACHVWDNAVRDGFDHDLCIFDLQDRAEGEAILPSVPLIGNIRRVKDPFDLAFVELDASVVSALPGRHWLRLDEVLLRPRPGGRCWVYGFPQETAEEVPERGLFRYTPFFTLAPFCRRPLAFEDYDPKA